MDRENRETIDHLSGRRVVMPPPLAQWSLCFADVFSAVEGSLLRFTIAKGRCKFRHRINWIDLIRETPHPASHDARYALISRDVPERTVALIFNQATVGFRRELFCLRQPFGICQASMQIGRA